MREPLISPSSQEAHVKSSYSYAQAAATKYNGTADKMALVTEIRFLTVLKSGSPTLRCQ
jgi:hypothetical protein